MAEINNITKNINVFVDGKGYAGEAKDFTPPKLEAITEEIRAGGMHTGLEVIMGQKAMKASFTMFGANRDVLRLWGVTSRASVPFVCREALENDDGTINPQIHTIRGLVTVVDMGKREPGKTGEVGYEIAVKYYKLEHSGEIIHEIDPANMIAVINGVDILANQRAALGI